MLIVETIAKIRRAFFVQGKPIKAICRELSVSRKVVGVGRASTQPPLGVQSPDILHSPEAGQWA
jgi:hypothetical protein